MQAFLCSNGVLTRADAPRVTGTYREVARKFGFEIHEAIPAHEDQPVCTICRPINNQEVYLTIHGQERSMYALVIWGFAGNPTFIFVPTPFDLVSAVEYVARFEKALYDVKYYTEQRAQPSHNHEPLVTPKEDT